MSLATRCSSCGTVFRVVRDQLRVSEGWVRCGRCNSVFSASEVLFDIDTGSPVPPDMLPAQTTDAMLHPAPAPVELVVARGAATDADADADADADEVLADDALADDTLTITDWAGPADADGRPTQTTGPPPRHDVDPEPGFGHLLRAPSADDADAVADADAESDDAVHISDGEAPADLSPALSPPLSPGFADPPTPARRWPGRQAAQPTAPAGPADSTGAPSFLRQADRAAWWRRRRVRGVLGAAVGLLGAALLGQLALINRDALAARVPATAPPLQTLCRLVGCQVLPPRRIDALTVDSSGLSRVVDGPAASRPDGAVTYRLQVLLHNRADTVLMMPALELSLTDAQGKLVLRRVLAMAELGVSQSHLAAGQQLPVTALVSAGALHIDGYTVELFYP